MKEQGNYNKFMFTVSHEQKNSKMLKQWETVDLKILLAVLALAKPSITQTEVAQRLKISPVTLSRLVNSEDHRIREEWIATLTECLSDVDLESILSTVNALSTIGKYAKQRAFLTNMIPTIERYVEQSGLNYKVDLDYWAINDGIVRFYNDEEGCQWLISMGSLNDMEQWRLVRTGLGPFSKYRSMKSIGPGDKVSILYNDMHSFAGSVKMHMYRQQHPENYSNLINLPCNQSLLFYNERYDAIEEEYMLLNDDVLF